MGSNVNKRISPLAPASASAPALSASSKRPKRHHHEVDDDEDFTLPPPLSSDEEGATDGAECFGEDEDGEEYEVEEIQGSRLDAESKQTLFLVKWKGYDEDENTWEPMENLANASSLLRDYEAARLKAVAAAATTAARKPAPAKSAAAEVIYFDSDSDDKDYEDEDRGGEEEREEEKEEEQEEDGPNDFDSDSDSDGSDDELETAAPAAPSGSKTEDEINRVLKPLGLEVFGTDVPFLDLLLGVSAISHEHRVALSAFRDECLQDMSIGRLSQSPESTDAFLERENDQEWASHDRDVDTLWHEFVGDIVRLGEGAIKREDLVKPSGPLRAILTFFWHYPTWNTQKKGFGHTLDKTNQSLQFQYRKTGPNSWVRTHDRFPFRHAYVKDGVNWEAEYPNWADIEARCHRFNKQMIEYSKIIFFIGQENHDSWQRFITLSQGDRLHQVQFTGSEGVNLPNSVYKAKPAFFTVRNSSGTVKQLVFSSYHSQFCVNGGDLVRGAYVDLIWNAALDFAKLEVKQFDTFTRAMGLDPKVATRFRCCFVDPETKEQCCATRQHLHSLRKHWDACHSRTAIWDESLVDELPKETALALDPEGVKSGKSYKIAEQEAAHREAVLGRQDEKQRANSVPVVKQRQRIGRRPKDLEGDRFRCYYVDSKTGERCKATYSTKESLGSMHFKDKHPGSRWNPNLVTVIEEDEAQWNTSRAAPETVTTQQDRKLAKGNARSAKSRNKLKDLVTLQCNYCNYSNKNHRSNMKTHVEKKHPNVIYNAKTSFTTIVKQSSDSDKENEE